MRNLLHRLRLVLFGAPAPPILEEERFPRDTAGRPDLTRFTRPLDHYIGYLEAYHASLSRAPRSTSDSGQAERDTSAWQAHAYREGVLGQWGLIARGPAEALRYVLTLLQHPLPEARQAGAGVLEAWTRGGGTHPDLAPHALAAAEREADATQPDLETLSTLVTLLGRLKTAEALPLLARVLRKPDASVGDIDWDVAEAVKAIAGDSFDRAGDARAAADGWLRARGL